MMPQLQHGGDGDTGVRDELATDELILHVLLALFLISLLWAGGATHSTGAYQERGDRDTQQKSGTLQMQLLALFAGVPHGTHGSMLFSRIVSRPLLPPPARKLR